MTSGLERLPEDVLIQIFGYLAVPDILISRQVCKQLQLVSSLHIVWINACTTNILQNHYPFPSLDIHTISAYELELHTRRAYHLKTRWLSKTSRWKCFSETVIRTSPSAPICDVHFIPGRGDKYILAVSKGIWSPLTLWDYSGDPKLCFEWSPQSAMFDKLAVNSDPDSLVAIAVGIYHESGHRIDMLSINEDGEMRIVCSIETAYQPILLQGNILAYSDHTSRTIIHDWTRNVQATLINVFDTEIPLHNRCLQVIFAFESILVVRARSMHLFKRPELRPTGDPIRESYPIVSHSFGWTDGVSIAKCHDADGTPALSILVRSECDNPWATDSNFLDLYHLYINPAYTEGDSPYLFPPVPVMSIPSRRGPLRCASLALGRSGSAIWIQPRDMNSSGLVYSSLRNGETPSLNEANHECLYAALFPGWLTRGGRLDTSVCDISEDKPCATGLISVNIGTSNWTCLDYNEERGRIALGSSHGIVTILKL